MEEVVAPEFFLCPISLQIMKDPVTAITGITYDRESIERWLSSHADDGRTRSCPVTKQPLPKTSDLTPNHNLRRLIQSWSTVQASKSVGRVPTPPAPIGDDVIPTLLRDLSDPRLAADALKVMETMADESETNRRCMVASGTAKRLVSLVAAVGNSTNHDKSTIVRVEQALRILSLLRPWSTNDDRRGVAHLAVDQGSVVSLTWVLNHGSLRRESKTRAILLLKSMFVLADTTTSRGGLDRLEPGFFGSMVRVLHTRIDPQTTKAALHVLLIACSWGTNKNKIADAGAVASIIELELTTPDKRTSELTLGVLDQLCSCADGRDHFLRHAASIAVVAKRILRVSPVADEKAVGILTAICRSSVMGETLREMLRVGAVSKLCMVLQANCPTKTKEKARLALKLHSGVWRDSPCIAVYLLTRYPQH